MFRKQPVPISGDLKRCFPRSAKWDLHILADASEQAFGAVACLRATDKDNHIHLAFIPAHSRVARKQMPSIPRLELCAALVAASLTSMLGRELTLQVACPVSWSDSTTVLT